MAKKFKAEMWDKMQYLFRNYYDRMMHIALYYDGKVNEEAMQKSIQYMIERIDVLHSSFHNNFIKPYWTINTNYSTSDYFEIIETKSENEEQVIDKFLTQQISVKAKVQVKLAIIRTEIRDIVCILQNHMCMDGGDLKIFKKLLISGYNQYLKEGKITVAIKNGTRSADQVYSTLSEEDKKHAKGLYNNISNVKDKTILPLTKPNNDISRIVREKLDKDTFAKMKAKGKEINATINDVILAAYLRSLVKICNKKPTERLSIPCMVDLRRHIEGGATYGFTNCTGFMLCDMVDGVGNTFKESITLVQKALEFSKQDKYIGLYSLPLLKLAYTIFPQFISEIAIRIGYSNPLIGMSNIGIMDVPNLELDGLNLVDCWMTGAVKSKPYVQLALTTFKSEITFSMAVKCNDEDEKIIKGFLQDIIKEITDFIQ